ncbi:Transcription factor, fungi [Penicillium italicum]|uniref:Transcription factor, fungi n=1 Tax=Penicillium italicum TaxID=40296 RepID=A0A0A2KZ27_PENIT|nr:Transcription factor, fungi [Penicillium italicum]
MASSKTKSAPGPRAAPRTLSPVEIDKLAPLACTECRRKHVKCDTAIPNCMRCVSSGAQCHYLPSRRGLKRRAVHVDQSLRTTALPEFVERRVPTFPVPIDLSNPSPRALTPPIAWEGRPNEEVTGHPAANRISSPSSSQDGPGASATSHGPANGDGMAQGIPSLPSRQDQVPGLASMPVEWQKEPGLASVEDDEALVNLYYANFHAGHPILVPRSLYTLQDYPDHLKLVVHFVGSQFSSTVSSDALSGLVTDQFSKAEGEDTPATKFHLVQAKLLYSIAIHACNEIQESTTILTQAVSLALEIGMHRKSFPIVHGMRSALEEESMRRTWWELYVTDGFMAALQRKPSFHCHAADSDVLLPCDESSYLEGSFANERLSVAQFDARIYSEEEIIFSSFSYRIGAIRLLARVLSIAWTHDLNENHVKIIDSALAAWPHHLDSAKADMCNIEDEMLFQGHMFILFCIMYLHFPRSDLVATIPGASKVIRQQQLLPIYSRNMHGVKALVASKQLIELATLQVPVQKHTPFFICGIVFAVLVQLSACCLSGAYGTPDQFHDRISLIIGILKTLSPSWALAKVTLRKVKRMAAETLSRDDSHRPAAVQLMSPNDSRIDFVTHMYDLPTDDLPWIDLFRWGDTTERTL